MELSQCIQAAIDRFPIDRAQGLDGGSRLENLIRESPAVREYIQREFFEFKSRERIGILQAIAELSGEQAFDEFEGLVADVPESDPNCAALSSAARRKRRARSRGQQHAVLCWKHYEVSERQERLSGFIADSASYCDSPVEEAVEVHLALFGTEGIEMALIELLSAASLRSGRYGLVPVVVEYGPEELRRRAIERFALILKSDATVEDPYELKRAMDRLNSSDDAHLVTLCSHLAKFGAIKEGGLSEAIAAFRAKHCTVP